MQDFQNETIRPSEGEPHQPASDAFYGRRPKQRCVVWLSIMLSVMFAVARVHSQAPAVPLIFDTDIGNDVDDVLALGMIHSLQSRGECRLLAVTITTDHELAAPFVDAVNTLYGRGDVPIGVCESGVTAQQGKFNGLASQRDGPSLRYPHDLVSGEDVPDAVDLLRKVLAAEADGSVVIAQVGFSTNLANLLRSKGDHHSPLDGVDLVEQKVRLYNPPPHDRPTWDLTSVLFAVRGDHDYFDLSEPGQVVVAAGGLTSFSPSSGGRDRHLIIRESQNPRVTEAMTLLSSQPPVR